jgi:hypothetical protein
MSRGLRGAEGGSKPPLEKPRRGLGEIIVAGDEAVEGVDGSGIGWGLISGGGSRGEGFPVLVADVNVGRVVEVLVLIRGRSGGDVPEVEALHDGGA